MVSPLGLGQDGHTYNINADAVDTPLFRSLVQRRAEEQGLTEEQMLERYAERGVFGKALVPTEAVAEAALWLASDRSAHTTGCVITVGGGAEGFSARAGGVERRGAPLSGDGLCTRCAAEDRHGL